MKSDNIPTVTINNVDILILSGLWPKVEGLILKKISNTFLISIFIKCHYIPFDMECYMAEFIIHSDFVLLGNLICSESIRFVKNEVSKDILNAHLKYVNSVIDTGIAEINLTIDKYIHIFNNDYSFPITFTFNNRHISQVLIKEIDFSGLSSFISHFNFNNIMESQPSDDEIELLLNKKKPIIQFPEIHFFIGRLILYFILLCQIL